VRVLEGSAATSSLVETLSADSNPKFQQSQFLKFVSKMSRGELEVDGNQVRGRGGGREALRTYPLARTNCTALSLIPTVNGNTVRSFSTHGQQSAAKGSSTTVSRSDLIQHFDSSAHGLVRRWLLLGYFLGPLTTQSLTRAM
jgi:hypothetical protein